MKARIIVNSIFVTTLLVSHALFAEPVTADRDTVRQEISGRVDNSGAEAAMTKDPQVNLANESRAEVLRRIMIDARQELSNQLDASEILGDAMTVVKDYLDISIISSDGKMRLTAR